MIPPLDPNTILMVEVGSTAHGTGREGQEDHDETAIVVETPHQVLGLGQGLQNHMYRTQPDGERSGPGDTDRQVYSLRKFLALAASGNPSIMLCLWAPVEHITPLGQELRDLAPKFIGRHMIARYRGYMQSQAMRLLGTKGGRGVRGGGGRTELIAAHGYDTKYAMHCARLGYQCIELLRDWELVLPIAGEVGDWLRAVRYGEISFDDWWKQVLWLDQALGFWLEEDDVPETADEEAIENFSVMAHWKTWMFGGDT